MMLMRANDKGIIKNTADMLANEILICFMIDHQKIMG